MGSYMGFYIVFAIFSSLFLSMISQVYIARYANDEKYLIDMNDTGKKELPDKGDKDKDKDVTKEGDNDYATAIEDDYDEAQEFSVIFEENSHENGEKGFMQDLDEEVDSSVEHSQ